MVKKISIKWRFFAYLCLFPAIAIVLSWIFRITLFSYFYKVFKYIDIKQIADRYATAVFDDDFSEKIRKLAFEEQICVLVLDKDKKVVVSAEAMAGCSLHNYTLKDIDRLYRATISYNGKYTRHLGYTVTYFEGENLGQELDDDKASVIVCRLVREEGKGERFLLFNTVITPVNATSNAFKAQFGFVSLMTLLLSLAIAIVVSKSISKPITKISEAAKELVNGNYRPYKGKLTYKEVAELDKTLTDVSKELKVTEHLRKEFLSNVSHDLRTPLTMIKGYSEMLRDIPEENTPENIQIIIDEASRLEALVNALFALSKLQSGNDKPVNCNFDLTELLNQIVTRYQKMLPEAVLSFQYAQSVTILADRERISQVIYNLLDNAWRYSGEDKRIEISQEVADGKVTVSIRDYGLGIPPEEQKRIWDKYYRVTKNHTRTNGTGLGLSIVSEILKLYEAEYGVESDVGKGSRFWFTLKLE